MYETERDDLDKKNQEWLEVTGPKIVSLPHGIQARLMIDVCASVCASVFGCVCVARKLSPSSIASITSMLSARAHSPSPSSTGQPSATLRST